MRLAPLTQMEAYMVGDWVMERVRRDNPDPRYVSPLHLDLEGRTPRQASAILRSVGYGMSVDDLLYQIRRIQW